MTSAIKTIKKLRKATRLTNRAFHKNGPKSFKRGQGALLKVLHHSDGVATSRELVDALSFDRAALKDVVRKASRNGFVTIEGSEEKRTYVVRLTEEGEKVAEKRCAANAEIADSIVSCLSEEEIAQLNAIADKIIVACKEQGAHGKRHNCKGHHHGHGHRHAHGRRCARH